MEGMDELIEDHTPYKYEKGYVWQLYCNLYRAFVGDDVPEEAWEAFDEKWEGAKCL